MVPTIRPHTAERALSCTLVVESWLRLLFFGVRGATLFARGDRFFSQGKGFLDHSPTADSFFGLSVLTTPPMGCVFRLPVSFSFFFFLLLLLPTCGLTGDGVCGRSFSFQLWLQRFL